MEFLKEWVSSICVTILFMTAVDLIMPDNNIKKYSKFVLGLIFIVVVMNPIIGLVKEDSDLYSSISFNEDYISKFDSYVESNLEGYSEKIKTATIQNFEDNLARNCKYALKEKFKSDDFIIDMDILYENKDFVIKELRVKVEESGVKSVQNVEDVVIGESQVFNSVKKEDVKTKEIKKILSEELNIPLNAIKIYN